MHDGENREFETTQLSKVITRAEWDKFNEEFCTVAEEFKHIVGALAIGSLVQNNASVDFFEQRRPGPLGIAYESIRNPSRRKASISRQSDLDIWIATKDTAESIKAGTKVDIAGCALIDELASGSLERGTLHWMKKKKACFEEFYKQNVFYHQLFIDQNYKKEPWMAYGFKDLLERQPIVNNLSFVERISHLSDEDIETIYPLLRGSDLRDAQEYLSSGPVMPIIIKANCSQNVMFKTVSKIKGVRISDRSDDRLREGCFVDGGVRDLLPLPGDEEQYQDLLKTIIEKEDQSI